jgi:hypothetical protein
MDNDKIIETGIEKLTESVKKIADTFHDWEYSSSEKETKIQTENAHFTGIAEMLHLLTGKEYHWSTPDKYCYNLVAVDSSDEETILFTVYNR